ncbi:hypothetical protein B0J14DRAFT_483797, partial [Halenospora varia]
LEHLLSSMPWAFDQHDRPPRSRGIFVALACMATDCGDFMTLVEGEKVKRVEGLPVSEEDRECSRRAREVGTANYNSIKDRKLNGNA